MRALWARDGRSQAHVPHQPPVQGLLGRSLEKNAPDMTWVADVVDRANERLDDRQAAIGPSYFMKDDLDEETVRLIWQHSPSVTAGSRDTR